MRSILFVALMSLGNMAVAEASPDAVRPPAEGSEARVWLAQFGGPFGPAPELREYRDRDGNRIFVDRYGNVVSIVPPERSSRQWDDQRAGDWRRRQPVLEGWVRGDPWGDDYYPEAPQSRGSDGWAPEQGGYGGPQYGWDGGSPYPEIERRALGSPRERNWREENDLGPRPYTPPSVTADGEQPTVAQGRGLPEIAALQVLLDRAGTSPGVIDGRMGSNVRKAMEAYERKTGTALDPSDPDSIMALLSVEGGLPIRQYTITEDDVDGPFIREVPHDYGEKARLEALSYTSPAELIAEKFHMDEAYLREINPNADFTVPGTVIKVADIGKNVTGTVTRIVADKGRKQVFAYDAKGKIIAAYPATIGSSATPSPSGTHKVERIAPDPNYTYNPKINFKQGDNDEVLTIPPGPNGPVGSMWIALSKPTYGIHGTPEPAKIGKTESNGCVRLTNWDAHELAAMVSPGVTVEFRDEPALVAGAKEDAAGPVAGPEMPQ